MVIKLNLIIMILMLYQPLHLSFCKVSRLFNNDWMPLQRTTPIVDNNTAKSVSSTL